ncbi:hypothetical protein M8J75_007920 [Diaphorina citri]|nr:hypothetical protein M8J75_007920 [Diaphorina citri]
MKFEAYDEQYERENMTPMSTTPSNGRHSASPELKHSESPLPLISPKLERCSPPLNAAGQPICIPDHLSIRPIQMKSLTSPPQLGDRPFHAGDRSLDRLERHSAPVDFRIPAAPSAVVSSSTCSPPIMMRPPPPPPPLKQRMEGKHHPHHPSHHQAQSHSSSHHEEPTIIFWYPTNRRLSKPILGNWGTADDSQNRPHSNAPETLPFRNTFPANDFNEQTIRTKHYT